MLFLFSEAFPLWETILHIESINLEPADLKRRKSETEVGMQLGRRRLRSRPELQMSFRRTLQNSFMKTRDARRS
jgi:hypothetical protein